MTTTLSAKSVDEILDFDISFSASNGGGVVGNPSGKIITMFTSIQGDGYVSGIIHVRILKDDLYQLIKDSVVGLTYDIVRESGIKVYDTQYYELLDAVERFRAEELMRLNELFGVKDDA